MQVCILRPTLTSPALPQVTKREFHIGKFETASLQELRQRLAAFRENEFVSGGITAGTCTASSDPSVNTGGLAAAVAPEHEGGIRQSAGSARSLGELRFLCVSDDVRALHKAPKNCGAVFQVAIDLI